MQKRTKIVCTLGPASGSKDTIEKMVRSGMNAARLNFSHGTWTNHQELLENVRKVSEETGESVAIIQDLQGPKIRVGVLPDEGVELGLGEEIAFDTDIAEYKDDVVPIDYKNLHQYVRSGDRILLDDGKLEVKVTRVGGTRIETEVIVGGKLTSHKGINIPDSGFTVGALTDKDKEDVEFGIKHNVDFIALSFVNKPEDIVDLRYLIEDYQKKLKIIPEQPIRLIAKIERREAVDNIESILEVADGIMVARGDLGIEIPAADVPLVQKRLIDAALSAAKPVIVATQMLDSMQNNPRPTRAEVSDVANAVIDHTDAVMLSNETATGNYPVEAVRTMSDIIVETEKSSYDDLIIREHNHKKQPIDNVISQMSRELAEDVKAKLILAASISGDTGKLISRNRPELPILVATSTDRVRYQLNLSWGVIPFILPTCNSIEELIERSVLYLKKENIAKKGEKIVVVAGEPVGHAGHVNLLEVREVS